MALSPTGDELTLDFAKALIEKENFGRDHIPDYLSISFSSADYIGHPFGPSSLESEDNFLRLDRTLADLFGYVDEKVGIDQTEVGRELAAELMKFDSIAAAVPSSDLLAGDVPDSPLIGQIQRNFHPSPNYS